MTDTAGSPKSFAAMASTEVPATTVHTDGTATAGSVRIVHAPGAAVPISSEAPCSPGCGCRP
jgi:hypothetical protein